MVICFKQKLHQLRLLPIDILPVQWLDAKYEVIAQSIAKVLAPMCFQNEAPVFEHVLNMFWTNMFSKCVGTQKCIPKHIQKQRPCFENTLQA